MSAAALRLLHELPWAETLEILSWLSLRDLYLCCGRLNRASFVVFLRERASRQCPAESQGTARFLSSGLQHEKVVLVSYPRSGNSLLRHLLESRFGMVTGSDSRPNRPLSESLLRCGFRGEGIVDHSVWVVKTHYPERMGYRRFPAARAVLVVRNPVDAIESYFHMGMTQTHSQRLSPASFARLDAVWPDFVAHEARVWATFHEFWLDAAQHVPTLFVRYEDMLADPAHALGRIGAFLVDGAPPLGWQRFREAVTAPGVPPASSAAAAGAAALASVSGGAGPGYAPKQGGVGKGLRLLSAALVREIVARAGHIMEVFGYHIHGDDLGGGGPDGPSPARLEVSDTALTSTAVLASFVAVRRTPLDSCSWCVPSPSPPSAADPAVAAALRMLGTGRDYVVINETFSIRTPDDPYGRRIADLRKTFTKDDTEPFETAGGGAVAAGTMR